MPNRISGGKEMREYVSTNDYYQTLSFVYEKLYSYAEFWPVDEAMNKVKWLMDNYDAMLIEYSYQCEDARKYDDDYDEYNDYDDKYFHEPERGEF